MKRSTLKRKTVSEKPVRIERKKISPKAFQSNARSPEKYIPEQVTLPNGTVIRVGSEVMCCIQGRKELIIGRAVDLSDPSVVTVETARGTTFKSGVYALTGVGGIPPMQRRALRKAV